MSSFTAKCITVFLPALVMLFWAAGADCREREKDALAPGNHTFRLQSGGLERQYIVHVPSGFDGMSPLPVVIMFHGAGGNAQTTMKETALTATADKERFLAVFPEGSRPEVTRPARFRDNPQTWNDGSNRANVGATQRGTDDVGFVNALLDEVMARYPVDRHRMYATGFSNGASMAFRVGRELAGRIAAIAPASGSDWLDQPSVSRPVPLLYITGTDDPLNPLEGGEQKLMRRTVGTKPPVDEQLGKWVTMLGCPPVPEVVRDSNGVRGVAYGPCREGSEVLYYTVEGMGHAWAGGKSTLPQWMVGKTSEKIKANDLIWDFFKRHVRK